MWWAGPGAAKLFDGVASPSTYSSSAAVATAMGMPVPIRFTNGVGTAGRGPSAIVFDPA